MLKPTRALLLQTSARRAAKPPPTHFTSTGPHAFAPPPAAKFQPPRGKVSSTIDVSGARQGETPHERVKRLRAAARAAKAAELPWTERLIDRGRVIADYSHRGFTLFLIGSSGLLLAFTAYAVTDMMVYNRRKRNEWKEENSVRNQKVLAEALEAKAKDTANIKQLLLVKRYEKVQEAEKERYENRGVVSKTIDLLFPGVASSQSEARIVMQLDKDILKAIEAGELPNILDEEEQKKLLGGSDDPSTSAAELSPKKLGPLDHAAQALADSTKYIKFWSR